MVAFTLFNLMERKLDTPYAPPKAAFASSAAAGDTYLPRMFGLHGRIGRVRYLVYSTVIPLLLTVAALLGYMISPGNSITALGFFLAIPIVGLGRVVQRRLHDLDKSGWWMGLIFVPVLGLGLVFYLLFGRGSAGINRFGAAPEPNSRNLELAAYGLMAVWVVALVFLVPACMEFSAKVTEQLEGAQNSSIAALAQDDAN